MKTGCRHRAWQQCVLLLYLLVMFTVPLALSGAESDGGEWQFFRVNAQYRGTVKKGFHNLGCAVAWCKDLPDNQLQAIVHVCALHPEKRNATYSFRLNLILQRQPDRYAIVKELYAEFSGITGERQQQIKQLVGLLAYMRDFTRSNQLSGTLNACGADLRLEERQTRKGKAREVDCRWDGRRDFSGKFFFDGHSEAGAVMNKFRFKSGKLSVSLVVDSPEAVNRDFAHRAPFATVVFK